MMLKFMDFGLVIMNSSFYRKTVSFNHFKEFSKFIRKESFMQRKNFLLFIFMLFILFCVSCNKETTSLLPITNTNSPTETIVTLKPSIIEKTIPTTNEELFDFIIEKWKENDTNELYSYVDQELQNLLNQENFVYLLDNLSTIGGTLNDISKKEKTTMNEIENYTCILDFKNIQLHLNISLKNLKICSFTYDMFFKNTFELRYDNNIVEQYFILTNDGYDLNAVYTYIDDGNNHPATLLIPGSGPSDFNETIGILTPFADIAHGLANNGVNSLRLDKRTLHYTNHAKVTDTIQEEYFKDFSVALNFLKEQNITNLYLLGHSLGGQIATELAKNDSEIDGIILFNSTARHLADIMSEQYIAIDPSNKETYETYAKLAKECVSSSCNGLYYYDTPDYYWASYNQLDIIKNIKETNIKTLMINSTYDKQIFIDDITLWQDTFFNYPNITIQIYDDISHFGYKIDTKNTVSLYNKMDFPIELIEEFCSFCK